MSAIWAFYGIKNKHDICRGKGRMKKFCKSIEEHAMEIVNFEKKIYTINRKGA